ncbi:2436_t:CDS:1, partial [Racocetra fulgida]
LVFISGKFIVENSEPCFTIAYSSIVDNGNPNREFDLSNVPITIPHSMYFVTATRQPKNVGDFIHFGAETIQYNSVTGNSDIKMDMTIIYSLHSSRFKYLGHLGSNIKLRSNYFVSGLFKFSKSGKMMIEATDIDYLRTSTINIGGSESSHSTMSNAPSIIDIIDDDIDSTVKKAPQDQYGSVKKSVNPVNADVEAAPSYSSKKYHTINADIEAGPSHDSKKYHTTTEDYQSDEKQSDHENGNEGDNENATDLACDDEFQDIEEQEESQPKKRKRAPKKATKGKGKKY